MQYTKPMIPDAVAMAYQIVDLWEENMELRAAAKRGKEYEHNYMELLNDSVKRGQEDIGNMLMLLMSPHVKFEINRD